MGKRAIYLIWIGAQVNALNKNNETPLHKAVFNNSVRILMVDLLIKNGADVTIVNTENLSGTLCWWPQLIL
jgi:ankyrin repeat protein